MNRLQQEAGTRPYSTVVAPGERRLVSSAGYHRCNALAYKLGNFLRRLALPKAVKEWSLWAAFN